VFDKDVVYRGPHYQSLSEVARAITGSRWSGPLFFGLKQLQAKTRREFHVAVVYLKPAFEVHTHHADHATMEPIIRVLNEDRRGRPARDHSDSGGKNGRARSCVCRKEFRALTE
jgi:hypothetical protein